MSGVPDAMSVEQLNGIEGMTSGELDALPFGAIQLDHEGTIIRFNEYEANLSDNRAPEAIGRNFFRDIAPCTDVREFYGRFLDGVRDGSLHVSFDYRFDFRPRPRDVRITLFHSKTTSTVWVFIQEK